MVDRINKHGESLLDEAPLSATVVMVQKALGCDVRKAYEFVRDAYNEAAR